MTNQATTATQHDLKTRSRLDVLAAILKIVNIREASKTRIMYGAHLSYAQIREYMPSLLENGLLTRTYEQQWLYKISERGMRFLKLYDDLDEMIAKEKRDWIYQWVIHHKGRSILCRAFAIFKYASRRPSAKMLGFVNIKEEYFFCEHRFISSVLTKIECQRLLHSYKYCYFLY